MPILTQTRRVEPGGADEARGVEGGAPGAGQLSQDPTPEAEGVAATGRGHRRQAEEEGRGRARVARAERRQQGDQDEKRRHAGPWVGEGESHCEFCGERRGRRTTVNCVGKGGGAGREHHSVGKNRCELGGGGPL